MGSQEKKMHLVDLSNLSILFKAKFGVSYSPPLRNTMSSLDSNFRIFSPSKCTEYIINHGRRVALIPFVNFSNQATTCCLAHDESSLSSVLCFLRVFFEAFNWTYNTFILVPLLY